MPFVFGPSEILGRAVVAGSGRTNAESCGSRGVVGWLVTSSGSYSKTSGMEFKVGEYSGDRGLPYAWLRGDDMAIVDVGGRDLRGRRRGFGCGRMNS